MPQLLSPQGIVVEDVNDHLCGHFDQGTLIEDNQIDMKSPCDLPVPDFGVLSSIVMDSYVPQCQLSSPVNNRLLFDESNVVDECNISFTNGLNKKLLMSDTFRKGKGAQAQRTRLVRSQTDPGFPFKADPATPCREHSVSQGDAPSASYRTPSDCGRPKLISGRAISRDWGKSNPSDTDDITKLRRMLNQLNCCSTLPLHTKISSLDKPLVYDLSLTERCKEERIRAKSRKSQAKWRRLSFGYTRDRRCHHMSSINSLPNGDFSMPNSFPMMRQSRSPSMVTESDEDEPTLISMFSTSASLKPNYSNSVSPSLNARNFRAIIIGGNFGLCFDDSHPVVTAAKRSERRVVAAWKQIDGSLFLKIFFPRESVSRIMDLGSEWSCIRARPEGYLVSKHQLKANVISICYFISIHPNDTAPMCKPRLDFITESSLLQKGPNIYETNYDNIVWPVEHSVMEHDKDLSEDNFLGGEIDRSIYNMETCSVISDDLTLYQGNDWNDVDVVSRILEYLPDSGVHLRSVSKLWAMSYYRCKVEHAANSKSCLSKTQFDNAMKNFRSPRFLSAGACKSVFRVSYKENENISEQALSIIDIEDLCKRNMDLCVQKEIKISLMCSVLSLLRICPNLLRIYSVFRSCYPPPRKSWRHSSGFEGVGVYQYIRMEYCSGGDLEGILREKKALNADMTRFVMFQMCFALYTCQDVLSMRHYDIKLLNFLCSSWDTPLTQARNTTSLNYAFENFLFSIPMLNRDVLIVKLADFGTSCIGNQSLGDPITLHQVFPTIIRW